MKSQAYRFSVAPMMDWSESQIFSIIWTVACARRVHREIKKNLATVSVGKLSEVGGAVAESAISSPRIPQLQLRLPSKAPWPQHGTHIIGD
ncbi:hypothetical protein [Bradyrhizobium nitroreducens]|uniref:hypothetical protein n=1 Tax=Bradyrhizobium nitroreducens TaxID=709803 RepID=UPI0011AE814B|nr:hypothetical protein [Bradyrhizobium nitroreducens]